MSSTDRCIIKGIRPGNIIIWEKDRHTIKLFSSKDGGSILYWDNSGSPDNQQIVDFVKTYNDFSDFVHFLATLHQLTVIPYGTTSGKPRFIFRKQKSS